MSGHCQGCQCPRARGQRVVADIRAMVERKVAWRPLSVDEMRALLAYYDDILDKSIKQEMER